MITPLTGLTFNMIADGALALTLDEIIGTITNDLENRGEKDGKKRSLKIQIDFSMVGGLVKIDPYIECKLPKYAPTITTGRIVFDPYAKKNVMVFNPAVVNVDQQTIDDALKQERDANEARELNG